MLTQGKCIVNKTNNGKGEVIWLSITRQEKGDYDDQDAWKNEDEVRYYTLIWRIRNWN